MLLLVALLAACGKKTPGQAVYGPHCGICHHGGGGMPGEIPPLVGRLDVIARTSEGRHYLADVLLNGLQGKFRTQGYTYDYGMPPFREQLSDRQIADVLNWLIARGDTRPVPALTSAEVAAARTRPGDPNATYAERIRLDHAHPIP